MMAGVRKHPLIRDFLHDNRGRAGCWEYPSSKDKDGYALYSDGTAPRRAHQAAYLEANGERPRGGLNVCHHCDNPACCRPDHLFTGSAKDNQADAKAKDRHSRGTRNGLAKLTDDAVREIRSSQLNQLQLAAAYGVRQSLIWRIIHRKAWVHVD